jgi:hypothetical protein
MPAPPLHDPIASPLAGVHTQVATASSCTSACRCGTCVHLRVGGHGREHPLNRGVICVKVSAGLVIALANHAQYPHYLAVS